MGARSIQAATFLLAILSTGSVAARKARTDWPMYNHDPSGSRNAAGEHSLGPANAANLTPVWSYTTAGAVTATPAVTGGRVFAGDLSGAFQSLRQRDGRLRWARQLNGPVSASALVTSKEVIIGDLAGYIYGMDPKTGALDWQIRPDPHPWAAIYGSATPVGQYVAVGVSSNEWFAPALIPGYPCCTFRGSVILLDPATGQVIWRTSMITDAEAAAGSSGAPVWSTPTYDPDLDLLFVTTGNNYMDPSSALSDSIIALDPATGAIVWANQRYANDTWNVSYPPFPPHPDYDIGDSAQVYSLPDGTKVVGAGQKSGFFHVLDAATGATLHQRQFQVAGTGVGGMFADSAAADGIVFANTSNYFYYGEIIAFTGDTNQELWRYNVPAGGATLSGVAVANQVVYFSAMDGNLYALRSTTGALLARVPIGANTSGPAIAGGRVFVGTGNGFGLLQGSAEPGSIVSLGVGCDEEDDDDDQ